jgi:hypothetical protein
MGRWGDGIYDSDDALDFFKQLATKLSEKRPTGFRRNKLSITVGG